MLISKVLSMFKLNPMYALKVAMRLPGFFRCQKQFKRMSETAASRGDFPLLKPYPMLFDESDSESGSARGAYFWQDLLVAQRIASANPVRHIDVGSRIDGFVAHVASFRRIDVVDIRPLTSDLPNVSFLQCDMMGDLPEHLSDSTDSLSCLHALEHFGLGRYGDPLDPDGHLKGFANLVKILKLGGVLYFAVPFGAQGVHFNAHRVFSLTYLLDMFKSHGLSVEWFSFVGDDRNVRMNAELTPESVRSNFEQAGNRNATAIFQLRKPDKNVVE